MEYALIPISTNLVHWAKQIVFVHLNNYDRALANFYYEDYESQRLIKEKAVIWEIDDVYEYMQPDLVDIIQDNILKLLSC